MQWKKKNNFLPAALLLALALPGCISTSVMQTAQTVPDKTSEIGLGIGNNDIYRNNYSQAFSPNLTFPELYYRRGLTEKTDLGVKLAFVGSTIDLKHNIAQSSDELFYCSTGGMLEYYLLDQASFAGLFMPLYFSFHPGDVVAFYAAGRAGASNIRSFFEASIVLNYNATGGIRLGGDNLKLFAEVTIGNTADYDFIPNQQITAGLRFRVPKAKE